MSQSELCKDKPKVTVIFILVTLCFFSMGGIVIVTGIIRGWHQYDFELSCGDFFFK